MEAFHPFQQFCQADMYLVLVALEYNLGPAWMVRPLLQTIATWIALLLLTFWCGGIIWETWIFAPQNHSASDHPTAIEQAAQRWRTYTPYALVGILIADVGIIVGQAAELAGDWSGSVSLPLLHAILFESQFGIFWWLREGVTLVALLFAVDLAQRQQASTKPTR